MFIFSVPSLAYLIALRKNSPTALRKAFSINKIYRYVSIVFCIIFGITHNLIPGLGALLLLLLSSLNCRALQKAFSKKASSTESEADQKAIEELLSQGSSVDTPREIRHYAYFNNHQNRESFQSALLHAGFKIDKISEAEDTDLKYSIVFSKIPSLKEISDTTQWLKEKAVELKGEYDGWESPVT